MPAISRRSFLRSSAAAGAFAGGEFSFLSTLPRVSNAESALPPAAVRLDSDIEPLVRLIEECTRERLLEEIAGRIREGATYRSVLAALLLAGVRNIQPRPVGFKFHAVLVVNSAHLASQNSPDSDRWLPIFWALDNFKGSQARDIQEGDWTMAPVDEPAVPSAEKCREAFTAAMDDWDEARADAAVAGLARTAGADEIFELLCRYGARDFRDIGHKAIFVANSWRTLDNIGWHHSEPVLRSLAYALLEHNGDNPAKRDDDADRPGRLNQELLKKIRVGWQGGSPDPEGTRQLLTALRDATPQQTAEKVVELLNRGVAPASLWDALFESCGEMLMRKPGIVTLHASTTANALHFAHRRVSNDETRRFLLLQAASFLPMFRDRAGDGIRSGVRIDELEPAPPAGGDATAVGGIFADLTADRLLAARKTLAYLKAGGPAKPFVDHAQRLIYLKGRDSHDYKFSSAVLEDWHHLSPTVRDRFLAASVFWLKGADAEDNGLVARTRAALGA